MKIQCGPHIINVETVPNTCDKCAHSDWAIKSPLGFPLCKVTGKSTFYERIHGSCARQGLNYKPITAEEIATQQTVKPKQDVLTIKIEKNNARFMYEWDEFHKKYGDCYYDDLTEEGKQAVSDLIDLQCKRDLKLFGKSNI